MLDPSNQDPMRIELRDTSCAICGAAVPSEEVYPASLSDEAFSAAVFSARRPPDGLHYRIVRCRSCGLLRSDPIAPPEALENLYRHSNVGYVEEIPNLRRTYGRYLDLVVKLGARNRSILEIGCGSGFLLEEAARRGFSHRRGVDPAQSSIEVEGILHEDFRPGLFPPATFDLIVGFQVMDHMPDPVATLRLAHDLLAPGGFILLLHHNAAAVSARLLGRRSPIVDVQHTFLFTLDTTRRILQDSGFTVVHVGRAINWVSVQHVNHLMPLPRRIRSLISSALGALKMDGLTLPLPLGNLVAVGRRSG